MVMMTGWLAILDLFFKMKKQNKSKLYICELLRKSDVFSVQASSGCDQWLIMSI